MSAIPQQVLDRQKASINTFVAAQSAVFAGFEKLVELNLKVVRATLDEVARALPALYPLPAGPPSRRRHG